MNYTITNEDAKRIIMSRLWLFVPAIVLGIAAGLLSRDNVGEMLPIVVPGVLTFVGLSVFIGLRNAKKKLMATQFVFDNDSLMEIKNGIPVKQLFFSEQLTAKENIMGFIIKGPEGFIGIPKQISCYNEMKAELESRIKR